MRLLTFTCPLCGAPRQRFPVRSAWARQAKSACRGCGIVVRSNPRLGMYSLYLLYTQIIAVLAALPSIWAYVTGEWVWLAVIWLVVLVLCGLPGAIRHARSPIVRAELDPNRSYACRPGRVADDDAAEANHDGSTP